MALSKQLFSNNAKTTLQIAVAPGDTTIQVVDVTKFPAITGTNYFLITIDNGSAIEIIKVQGVSGNAFTNCIRGYENTTSSSFQVGTRVENRLSAGTITNFLPNDSRFAELTSIDLLTAPINSNGNSYITHSLDDVGNPILVVRSSDSTWRLSTHTRTAFTGVVATGGLTSSVGSATIIGIGTIAAGRYVIQFTSGGNAGLCRVVTNVTGSTVSWGTPLPVATSINDTFEIYKSTASVISDLEAAGSNAIIYSILLGE